MCDMTRPTILLYRKIVGNANFNNSKRTAATNWLRFPFFIKNSEFNWHSLKKLLPNVNPIQWPNNHVEMIYDGNFPRLWIVMRRSNNDYRLGKEFQLQSLSQDDVIRLRWKWRRFSYNLNISSQIIYWKMITCDGKRKFTMAVFDADEAIHSILCDPIRDQKSFIFARFIWLVIFLVMASFQYYSIY